MKKLFLLRHGKSAWPTEAINDHERPLKKRGEDDAKLIGDWLHANSENHPETIYCSSAKRAVQTISIVRPLISSIIPLQIRTDLYSFSSFEVLSKIYELEDQYEKVLLVGHNPAYTELFRFFTGKDLNNLPTSGLVILSFEANHWKSIDPKNLIQYGVITPKELR